MQSRSARGNRRPAHISASADFRPNGHDLCPRRMRDAAPREPRSRPRESVCMNIVVLMKQVPDTEGDRKLDPNDNTVDRAAVDPVINYIDEFAIEEGLLLKEAHGGEVTILTVGPERASESIRKALSMGADKALHVNDEGIHGSDAIATA